MNILKVIILTSFLFSSGILTAQNLKSEKDNRIVVVVQKQAAVASLDTTGAIIQVIMPIPGYFDEDFDDTHYITKSYIKNPIHSTELNQSSSDTLAKIENKEASPEG